MRTHGIDRHTRLEGVALHHYFVNRVPGNGSIEAAFGILDRSKKRLVLIFTVVSGIEVLLQKCHWRWLNRNVSDFEALPVDGDGLSSSAQRVILHAHRAELGAMSFLDCVKKTQ